MKQVFKLSIISMVIMLLTLITSCSSKKSTVITETVEKTIIETIRDTTFVIAQDSSSIKALIECINGKPQIKELLEVNSGKDLKPPKVTLKDNILQVNCEKEAQELFASWKEQHITENRNKNTAIEIVKPLTWYQQTQIFAGNLLFILLLLVLFYWLIKKQFNAFGLK